MFRVIPDLIAIVQQFVPMWLVAVVGAVIVPFIVLRWIAYVQLKQIRGKLRTAFRTPEGPARDAIVEEAFAKAGTSADRLLGLAMSAHAVGMKIVARRALNLASDNGASEAAVDALRVQIDGPKKHVEDAFAEAVAVERLIDAELYVGARERLDSALSHHPNDEELRALDAQLTERLERRSGPSRSP